MLIRRFRSAQAFVVKPGSVEAANASLSGREHRAGIREMTKSEARNPKQVRMTKSENAPVEKRPMVATQAESEAAT